MYFVNTNRFVGDTLVVTLTAVLLTDAVFSNHQIRANEACMSHG